MNQQSKVKEYLKSGFLKGVGLSVGFLSTSLFAAAAAMNVFSPGEVISSAEINQNFAIAAPEGAVMAFYLADCPEGWAVADGTNGTPDLRGRFIRGMDDVGVGAAGVDPDSATRALGDEQLDAFQSHLHWRNSSHHPEAYLHMSGGTLTYVVGPWSTVLATHTGEPSTHGTNGDPRTSTETRPRNVALIYCMRKN
ncbi:MAG: tail fiber protein [Leptonema illini]|jgi:hypothetical protein|uniref:Tail fiber protein n=1 Tax=Leptonema illini TaxID=183 RepID=A0A833GXD6_9LEPT|nr:MAG: tail fiber protein [Leptonema illini]